MDCIFCKIIKGDIPSEKIYEDDDCLAFLDISPNNPGHTLVIPKDHFENIYTLPDEALCRLSLAVKKVSLAIKHGTEADGVNIIMNNEEDAGQEVFHAHIHVIPRHKNDSLTHFERKKYAPHEAESIAEKIRENF